MQITKEKLLQLLGSAQANKQDAITAIRKAQEDARELIASYDGAIGVLSMLIDDLGAQEMDALSLDDFKKTMPPGVEVEGIVIKDGA